MSTFSDDFQSYSDGDLAGQGPWVSCLSTSGSIFNVVSDLTPNKTINSWDGVNTIYRLNTNWNNDQSAQITIASILDAAFIRYGVAVRCSGSDATSKGYFYTACGSVWAAHKYLYKVINGALTILASSSTEYNGVDGDTYKIVVSGTSIKCYLNGVLDATMGNGSNGCTGTGGDYVDSSISSGTPGVYARDSGFAYCDSFVAEGLIEGASSAIKSVNGLAKASVSKVNGLAIASVKSWNGLA
jgi:hypothetical protein